MKHKLEAILFDMDGTLLDSEPIWLRADLAMIAAYGGFMTEEEHDACIGMGASTFIPMVKERYGIEAPFEELCEFQEKTYLEIARAEIEAFPEMVKFAQWAKDQNIPIAIASGSTKAIIEEMTEIAGVKGLFPIRVSAQEVERGKPDGDVFLEAVKRLAVRPQNCLVVEDSTVGVEAAHRAGMHSVAVPPSVVQDPDNYLSKADKIYPRGMVEFTAGDLISWLEENFLY